VGADEIKAIQETRILAHMGEKSTSLGSQGDKDIQVIVTGGWDIKLQSEND
jgi:hypothetical protein